MNAHILGFHIMPPSGISLTDVLNHLAKNEEDSFAGYDRLLFLSETDKYHTGLFLTTKDHRRFCELQRQGKNLKINVRETAAGASLIDFNFFAIRKTTGRGVYQWYWQSCHPKLFCRYCVSRVATLQRILADKEIAAKGGDKISDREKLKIEQKYEEPLKWQLLVRREAFEALIAKFEQIGSFEFSFGSVEPERQRRFRPLSGVSKLVRHQITFNREVNVQERLKAILEFMKAERDNLVEASAAGRDEDGLEKIIRLSENPDSFGHYEFDELAKGMDFEPSTFPSSAFMSVLLKVAEDHAHILEPKVK